MNAILAHVASAGRLNSNPFMRRNERNDLIVNRAAVLDAPDQPARPFDLEPQHLGRTQKLPGMHDVSLVERAIEITFNEKSFGGPWRRV